MGFYHFESKYHRERIWNGDMSRGLLDPKCHTVIVCEKWKTDIWFSFKYETKSCKNGSLSVFCEETQGLQTINKAWNKIKTPAKESVERKKVSYYELGNQIENKRTD